jgi:hypothetical protein
MPVLYVPRNPHDIAGANFLPGAIFALYPAGTLRDYQRLTEWMQQSRIACAVSRSDSLATAAELRHSSAAFGRRLTRESDAEVCESTQRYDAHVAK